MGGPGGRAPSKKQQPSRADRLAEVQGDVYQVAERLEAFAEELSEAQEPLREPCVVGQPDAPTAAPVPVGNDFDTDARNLLLGIGEMVREQEAFLERARRELGDLTVEIESWRMNIEEHFASTDRYARLEECEGQLNELLEAISYLNWFEGNFKEYDADLRRRKGADADTPHRVTYRKLVRS